MSGGQQIVREIQAVEALHNFLVDKVCFEIDEVNARFRAYIGIMAGTGVQEEACQRFTNDFYSVDASYFKAIYNKIIDADLPQIRSYIEQLLRQFQAATNSGYGNVSLHNPSPASTQGSINATERSGGPNDYEVQLNAVCDFMDFLVNERDSLNQTIQQYQQYCNNMLESGVPRQIVQHYVSNYATPNVGHINKMMAHIQDEDYKQLAGVYIELVASLKAIGQSVSRSPKAM